VVATTEQGLARSDDGGRNFVPVPGAPLMLLVSWAEDGALVGVGPEGTVYTSPGDGQPWEQRAQLDGRPEALLAVTADEVYAAAGGDILVSTNGAENFNVRHEG
jgi:hypothetical protein